MAGNNIFIAKQKNKRTHVFLRAYRQEALAKVDFAFSTDTLDKFLLAQDPESFTYAVSNFYPLSLEPLCKRELKTRPRMQTVKQFRANCDSFYEAIDEVVLMEEYTGVKDNGIEINKASLKRAVKGFDAIRNDSFLRYLSDNAFAENDYVIAEPVQDWTAAKAFVSNIILFQAYIGNKAVSPTSDEVALHNGYWLFGKVFDERITERVKQFVYNPEWRNKTARDTPTDLFSSETANFSNPLLSKYFDWSDEDSKNHLRNSTHIHLKATPSIFGEPFSFFPKAHKAVTDRSLYLVADLDCSEIEIAHDFINAVLLTTQKLKSEKNVPLGWKSDFTVAAEQADKPRTIFLSQWSQLVYEVAFHPHDVKATVCKNCGRPMLNQPGSKPRQFCRPSCRTAFAANHKKNGND